MSGLTDFQVTVTRLFFSLPASSGFLFAGGGALLASGLTTRPTQDLDFFGGSAHVDIEAARDQFETAVVQRGWRCERVQDSGSFVRFRLSGDDDIVVDLAIDVPAERPPVITIAGPTLHPEELAGRKLAALFGRAEARDFADVFALAQHFDRSVIMQRAAEVDLGFDRRVLAEMMMTIDRFDDDELPIDPSKVAALRAFFEHWPTNSAVRRTHPVDAAVITLPAHTAGAEKHGPNPDGGSDRFRCLATSHGGRGGT